MEYEISDEPRLFDESTNPSLEQRSVRLHSWGKPRAKAAPQVAVFIPEEEHQLS